MSASRLRWGKVVLHAGALAAIAALLVVLVPVTVWRCQAHEAERAARCRIESTVAAVAVRSAVEIERIANARPGWGGLGIRLVDARGRILYVRDAPSIVGTGMSELASGIQALA